MRFRVIFILILLLISLDRAMATAQEMYQIKAQHAGDWLYSGPNFQLYEQTNYQNEGINYDGSQRYFGQSKCQTEVKSGTSTTTTSHLVAIVDLDRKFNFTRTWLWNNLRQPILNDVLPEHCPNADHAVVRVFIKGYDVTISGEVYEIAQTQLPKIPIPVSGEKSGSLDPGKVQFNNQLEEFVSDGIVQAVFLTDKTARERPCLEHVANCSFETFTPAYRVAGFASGARWRLGLNTSPETKAVWRSRMNKILEHGDQNGNFDYLVRELRRLADKS
ncbi:MAG: hypothetical protein AAF996_16755 [Pseudomonadota bacterium]